MASIKGHAVQHSTFLKWGVYGAVKARVETIEGKQMVTQVYCSTCACHYKGIAADYRIKGTAEKEVRKYAEGTTFVTKWTVARHLNSLAHRIGLELEALNPPTSTDSTATCSSPDGDASFSSKSSTSCRKQPRIDNVLKTNAIDAYRKLLHTAYISATDGLPLSKFKTLVKVQKANGVKLISGCDSSKACREFVHEIADSIREKLAVIIASLNAFSVLSDGSQAKKTNAEKELVLIRIVRGGIPVYHCVSLEDIDSYGDATAENIKRAIDYTFKERLNLSEDQYTKCFVSATSDGASVNTGAYNGLMVRLKNDGRAWLVTIHCASHRLELAMKDSLLKTSAFKDVYDLLVGLYYLFKRSGKLKRKVKSLGDILKVDALVFPKVHGTRFVAHQLKGISHLLHNWPLLVQCFENCVADPKYKSMKAKLRGFLKKLKDFNFLLNCLFFKKVLGNIVELSLKLEREALFMFQLPELLQGTLDSNDELVMETVESVLKFASVELAVDENSNYSGSTVSWKMAKSGHMRRKPENREFTLVSVDNMVHIDQAVNHLAVLKRVLTSVHHCLEQRLQVSDEIFLNMRFVDPTFWGSIEDDMKLILSVAGHFKVTLEYANFNFDRKVLKNEWRALKNLADMFYRGWKATKLWKQIMQFRRKEFRNICLLVEIVFSIGPSNSMVEKCFSQLTSMLSDRRTNLGDGTMEDLLLIQINHLSWTPRERDEIIQSALEKHMAKRRKLQLDTTQFNLIGTELSRRGHKRAQDETDSDMSEHELDDDNDDSNTNDVYIENSREESVVEDDELMTSDILQVDEIEDEDDDEEDPLFDVEEAESILAKFEEIGKEIDNELGDHMDNS